MRQMIRYNNTGEVLVMDTATKACTPALAHDEQSNPLADYEIDYQFSGDESNYSVMEATR
jgi:hypothetical protein